MISLLNKLLIYFSLILTIEAKPVVFTDLEDPHLPSDFEYQGEYEKASLMVLKLFLLEWAASMPFFF